MYLRVTERRNRDGSTVAYYALAENVWNAKAKRSEAQVVHNFGRADRIDKAALQRLVASINRVVDADAADALPTRGKTTAAEIDVDAVVELGVVLAARGLWEEPEPRQKPRSRAHQTARSLAPRLDAMVPGEAQQAGMEAGGTATSSSTALLMLLQL